MFSLVLADDQAFYLNNVTDTTTSMPVKTKMVMAMV